MTTYSYLDKELTEINDYFERNAYYQQAKQAFDKGEEVSSLPLGENASADLLYILNDNREDARFNAFFVRNTILEILNAGHMRAASNMIAYLAQDNQSRPFYQNPHREMIDSVISERLRSNPDLLNSLEPHAKFTIADIFAEKDAYKLKNTNFGNFNVKDSDKYLAGNAAKDFLNRAIKNKTLDQIPWELKAKALDVATQGSNDVPFMEVYLNLLNTANEPYHTEERVKTLADIAQESAHLFQYDNKQMPQDWANKIPVCAGAQKLFYNMMYYMKVPSPSQIPYTSSNSAAYENARKEVGAQRIIDGIANYKRGLLQEELDVLAQYRPEFLLAKKDLSVENKLSLLKNPNFKISDTKRLQMMNEILDEEKGLDAWNDKGLEKEDISFFLSSAENMKTVSPEMNKFIHAIEPFVKREDDINKRNMADLEKANEAQKKLDDAQQNYRQINSAQSSVMAVFNSIDDILKHKSEEKDSFTKESLKTLVFNALEGKEPNKLDYQKQGKLSSLFLSAKEKERQENLRVAINNFNFDIQKAKLVKDVFTQMKTSFNPNTYYQLAETAYKNLQNAQIERNSSVYDTFYLSKVIEKYEQDNLGNRWQNLSQNYETRRTNLQAKAREALSFAFKGQEFGGEPMLAEHERQTKKIYKKHAEELRSKINDAARKEMEERGVYEKPDLESPNQTGKPMTKESASKVTKLMRDKKLYEKLAKD